MNAWAKHMMVENVKMISRWIREPKIHGMSLGKNHLGFVTEAGDTWQLINNGVVEAWWQELTNNDGEDNDPLNHPEYDGIFRSTPSQ